MGKVDKNLTSLISVKNAPVCGHSVQKCAINLFKLQARLIKLIKVNKIIRSSFELCTWNVDFDVGKVDIFSVSPDFFSKMLQVWRHSVQKCATKLFKKLARLIIWMKVTNFFLLLFEFCTWKVYFNLGKVDIYSVSHWNFQKKLKLWDFFC